MHRPASNMSVSQSVSPVSWLVRQLEEQTNRQADIRSETESLFSHVSVKLGWTLGISWLSGTFVLCPLPSPVTAAQLFALMAAPASLAARL